MFRKYKIPRRKSGQSTVEYIVLVCAVIGIVVIFMNGPNSVFQKKVNSTLGTATQGMEDKASALDASHSSVTFTHGSQIHTDPAHVQPFAGTPVPPKN